MISRGHQVFYYSYNMMREKIEATGATFVSCDEYDQEQRLDAKDAVRVGKDLACLCQTINPVTYDNDRLKIYIDLCTTPFRPPSTFLPFRSLH